MKLLFENWRQYLTEQAEFWGYKISPDQKIFISAKPYTGFRDVQQEKPEFETLSWDKPRGLWYACGDVWIEQGKRIAPNWLKEANYLYEIKLGKGILQISNDGAFDSLEHNFGRKDHRGRSAMDWKKVQDQGYSGIEICPYNSGRPTSSVWYRSWDVASGCVWNSAGIADVILLAERKGEEDETPI